LLIDLKTTPWRSGFFISMRLQPREKNRLSENDIEIADPDSEWLIMLKE
jgi:hypothetical protein